MNDTTKNLAEDILKNHEEEEEEEEEKETPNFSFDDEEENLEPPEPQRIFLEEGISPGTAFKLKHHYQKFSVLSEIFGPADGDYFIHSEDDYDVMKMRYRVVLVEDRNGFRYHIWFDVTDLGYLANIRTFRH